MSCYTSLGITVSPSAGLHFLRFLRTLEEAPDTVARTKDGAVTAIWEDRNHFDEYSDSEYSKIIEFTENLGDGEYVYESVTEGEAPVLGGRYSFGFARVVAYDVYGERIDLDPVTSGNRKRSRLALFGRR